MLVMKEKETTRKKLLERLLSLTSEEVERRSRHVEETIQKLPQYINAQCIMGYYPLKGEVNLLGILRKALQAKRVCFPLIKGNELFPYQVHDLDNDFIPGPLGVRQPDPEKAAAIDPRDLDLVVVPGIGFDRQHNRLGRGAGFYDRFLKTLDKKTVTLGVSFDFQVLDDLPHLSSHDQKVDFLVTDTTRCL